MANEIKNISHAALAVRLNAGAVPPVVLMEWGIVSIARFFSGLYIAILKEPIAGVSGPAPGELDSREAAVLSSSVAGANKVEVTLATSAPMPPGEPVQLDALIIAVINPAGAVTNALARVDIEIRRAPTKY